MNGTEKFESAEQEIEALRKRIIELESASVGKEKGEIIKEVLREHTERQPEQILKEEHRLQPEEAKRQAQRIIGLKEDLSAEAPPANWRAGLAEAEPHQRQVAELLQFAREKGVLNAVSIIKEVNDPHLEDDFHDALAQFFHGLKNV